MIKIIETLDKALMYGEGKVREHHYPSDGVKCSRQLWYSWNKVPKSNPIEASQLCKMQMGNAIHEQFAKILNEYPEKTYTIETEIPFRVDVGLKNKLSGRMDNILTDTATGDKYIIELKSGFGRGIQEIQRSQMPKDDHIAQIVTYLKFANTGAKTGILLYIARDSAYRTEFWIQLCEDNHILVNGRKYIYDIQKLIDNFKEAEQVEIPDRKYRVIIKNGEIKEKCIVKGVEYKSDWQCLYCGHMDLCWQDKIKESINE
jgi:hypothetical protein